MANGNREPVETKVKAAASTALVAAFVVAWVVHVVPGLKAAAEPLQDAVTAVIASGLAWLAGWLAKHTPRT